MVTEIRLYVEGGDRKESKKDLRKGLRAFLKEVDDLAKQRGVGFQVIFCGSDEFTFKDFKNGMAIYPASFNVLLVDSDGPVTQSPWNHMKTQEKRKNWDPAGIDDIHCHLMVQEMEAWFMADVDALKSFYGQGFNENSLPQNQNVEQIDKSRIVAGLESATKETSKGKYHKTIHAPAILGKLKSSKVRKAAPHCERLFQTLTEKMS